MACRRRTIDADVYNSPAQPPALPPRLPGSFLGVRGRELDEKWDDTGAGACFFLEQEMSDAMTGGAGV